MSHPKPQPPQGWDALCAAAAAEGAEEPALTTTHTAAADSRTDGLHAASATTIRLLHRDGLQSVLSLLTRDELWSARLVSVGWAQTAALERRRRMIQLQTQIVTLISNNEAAGRAWKELCAASDPAAVPSLQSDALSTMLRCISISEPSSANALSRPRAARAIDLVCATHARGHRTRDLMCQRPCTELSVCPAVSLLLAIRWRSLCRAHRLRARSC